MRFRAPLFALLGILVSSLSLSPASATMAVVSGAFTNYLATASATGVQTTLNPDLPGAPILQPDPSNGFTGAMTGSLASADWWGDEITTFDYTGSLNGTLYVDVYRAGADPAPFGFADLLVRYTRGAGDPLASDLFWIQTVDTSQRGNNVPANEQIPYADVYASGYPAGQKLPFYFRPDEVDLDSNAWITAHGGANGNTSRAPIRSSNYTVGGNNYTYDIAFFDRPSRAPTNYWRGELFLASYDAPNKTVVVYDGIRWGFDVVPEPSTGLLLALGTVMIAAWRRRQ